ncbi:MAG: hypothetical protein AAB398_05350 [Pseudomonadota bacterium]
MDRAQWVTFFTVLSVASVSAIIVVTGWYVTNWQTVDREARKRQDEMRITYLTGAYDRLAISSNRQLNDETARMLEEAVAKIQLYGSPHEIALLHKFLDEWDTSAKTTGTPRGNVDALLFSLRNVLRKDLELPAVASDVRWIRPMGGAKWSLRR